MKEYNVFIKTNKGDFNYNTIATSKKVALAKFPYSVIGSYDIEFNQIRYKEKEIPTIILSLKAKYWNLIYSGKKEFEIRKHTPDYRHFRVLVYETKSSGGCGKIVGEFLVIKTFIFKYDIDEPILQRYGQSNLTVIENKSCLTHEEIIDYLSNSKGRGYAWNISNPIKYVTPIAIDNPPQSYRFLNENEKNIFLK